MQPILAENFNYFAEFINPITIDLENSYTITTFETIPDIKKNDNLNQSITKKGRNVKSNPKSSLVNLRKQRNKLMSIIKTKNQIYSRNSIHDISNPENNKESKLDEEENNDENSCLFPENYENDEIKLDNLTQNSFFDQSHTLNNSYTYKKKKVSALSSDNFDKICNYTSYFTMGNAPNSIGIKKGQILFNNRKFMRYNLYLPEDICTNKNEIEYQISNTIIENGINDIAKLSRKPVLTVNTKESWSFYDLIFKVIFLIRESKKNSKNSIFERRITLPKINTFK